MAAMVAKMLAIWVLGMVVAAFPVGGRPALAAESDLSAGPIVAGMLLAQGSDAGREDFSVKLSDLELIDQDGKTVKFATDVLLDRVAVIIPFYTTCTTNYPILISMLTQLQRILGDRLGKEVVLVSVSVDPAMDTPIRLKAFAQRQKASPDWVFLTGAKDTLGQVLWGLGVLHSPDLEEHGHIPVTVVGAAGGRWRRLHGFPSPDQVRGQIDELLKAGAGSGEGSRAGAKPTALALPDSPRSPRLEARAPQGPDLDRFRPGPGGGAGRFRFRSFGF
jgi:protein SCO1/2